MPLRARAGHEKETRNEEGAPEKSVFYWPFAGAHHRSQSTEVVANSQLGSSVACFNENQRLIVIALLCAGPLVHFVKDGLPQFCGA